MFAVTISGQVVLKACQLGKFLLGTFQSSPLSMTGEVMEPR